MKKLVLIIAACSFIGFSANAQSTSFGVRAGMTAANMKAKSSGITMSLDTKIGFYAGVLAEMGISENFAVEPQLYFSQMGAKVKINLGGESFTGSSESGYINLPVLLKYKNSGFAVFAGPQIGYLLYAKDKSGGESNDSKDSYKSTDFSGIVGVGYTFINGFGFDARYQFGLSNISKDAGEDDGSVKNNAFAVGVHYFFNR